jgi:hypothetical protein
MGNIAETGFDKRCNLLIALFSTVVWLAASPRAEAANAAPAISGHPATTVAAGVEYWFRPAASDANGDTLKFSIQNKPGWIWFDSTKGALWGAPTNAQAGIYGGIVISVNDGYVSRSLPAFSIQVTSTANATPKISGTPPTSLIVGAAYTFKPTATDANGDKLTFSISTKPAWATFNAATGQLAGTPSATYVGTTSNIAIKVSDGKATASLPVFSITVTQIAMGSASLSWIPPTSNTNGSALTNLVGYRIHYGTSSTSLTQTAQIANAGITRFVVENLGVGTWYFGVRAYTSNGSESSLSKLAIKIIK